MTVPNFDYLSTAQSDATKVVNSQVAKPFIDPTPIEKARWELAHKGITDTQQKLAYKGLISDAMYQNVEPYSYQHHGLEVLNAAKQAITSQVIPDTVPDRNKTSVFRSGAEKAYSSIDDETKRRNDAWRLYLGLPQKYDTFDISSFSPAKSQDQKPYFKLKEFPISGSRTTPQVPTSVSPLIIKDLLHRIDLFNEDKTPAIQVDSDANVMGTFKIDKGQDKAGSYISYYDKWDLNKSGAELAGHPYEIYDRIYYDPKTYKPIPEAVVLQKLKAK